MDRKRKQLTYCY
jgi:hypothetical protein